VKRALASTVQPESFTVVIIPDPQNMVAYNADIWTSLCDWVAANKDTYNIIATACVGDLVNTATIAAEWTRAVAGAATIEAVMPYLPILGNHDYDADNPGGDIVLRDATTYNANFGPAHFSGQSWYGGSYPPGSNVNFYGTFSPTVGVNLLILGLELFPRPASVSWGLDVIDAHPNHRVIVVTHAYRTNDNTLFADGDTFGPTYYGMDGADYNGADLWAVLKAKPNVDIIVGGHDTNFPYHAYTLGTADDAHTIGEIFWNWQGAANGGDGWVGMLTFDPVGATITARAYRTWAASGLGFDATKEQEIAWGL
jgi:hypothetical protein